VHLDEPPLFGYGQTADDFVSGTLDGRPTF
jgi:hypothetical protein